MASSAEVCLRQVLGHPICCTWGPATNDASAGQEVAEPQVSAGMWKEGQGARAKLR